MAPMLRWVASLLMVAPQSCPDTDTLKIAAGSSLTPYALRLNESESAKVHGSLLARIILERVGS